MENKIVIESIIEALEEEIEILRTKNVDQSEMIARHQKSISDLKIELKGRQIFNV